MQFYIQCKLYAMLYNQPNKYYSNSMDKHFRVDDGYNNTITKKNALVAFITMSRWDLWHCEYLINFAKNLVSDFDKLSYLDVGLFNDLPEVRTILNLRLEGTIKERELEVMSGIIYIVFMIKKNIERESMIQKLEKVLEYKVSFFDPNSYLY